MQRKVVTVFFSDLVGSTELGESLDPEALRRLLARYFDEVRVVLERHGGRLEKYIGDAVVALFGVPVAREDDALRALRAAVEIRSRLEKLNERFQRDFGVRLSVRTGIHTGEVLVDPEAAPGFTAAGDTMNVAARLEQSAGVDEILIGAQTRALGGEAIEVEDVEPLVVKGKSGPVPAHRLLRVLTDRPVYGRRDDVPLVGRQQELASLRTALAWTEERRACFVATVVASPGIGKSRLAREFVAGLGEDRRVLVGRCPADAEGRSYLPLADALGPVLGSGSDARTRVLELLADDERAEAIADRVASAIGAEDAAGATEETFWAFRRLLETLAAERTLVLVLDDVHWAEATLLDLVEHLASFSRGAPVFLLCLSRPELLDERPAWSRPRENGAVTLLSPLGEEESAELVARLSPERELAAADLRKVVDAAEGNPLFLEQLLALNAGRGSASPLEIPPTIQALLQARIDRLPRAERDLLEAASVEGRIFTRSAVAALTGAAEDADLDAALSALVRKQLIRPWSPAGPDDGGIAFAHALVRDAAYAAMAKEVRAEFHERLGNRLEAESPDAVEVIGHHLAEAARYRRELGDDDERTTAIARRAAEHLTSGGRRALAAGDDQAAARLLDHAASLVSIEEPLGREIRGDLGRAFTGTGELLRARASFANVRDAARARGERALALRAELGLANFRVQTDPTMSNEELVAIAESAIPVFEAEKDEYGLALSWFLIHWTQFREGRYRDSIDIAERAVGHAARARDMREQLRSLGAIAMASLWGPTPVAEAREKLDELVERSGGSRLMEAFAHRVRGGLCSLTGEFEPGREHCREAIEVYRELGHRVSAVGVVVELQRVERKAGRLDVAEEGLRTAYRAAEELGDLGYVSWITASLARVLAEREKFDEARDLVERDDLNQHFAYTRVVSELVRSLAWLSDGNRERAEVNAEKALALVERTDILDLHGDVLLHVAELEDAAGRHAAAAERVAAAIELYERKGDVVSAARARSRSEPLGAETA